MSREQKRRSTGLTAPKRSRTQVYVYRGLATLLALLLFAGAILIALYPLYSR